MNFQTKYPHLALLLQGVSSTETIDQLPPLPDVDILYVVGVARGDPTAWLEAHPKRHLVFLEESLSRLKTFENHYIDHPRIHIYHSVDEQMLEECAFRFPAEKIDVIGRQGKKRQQIRLELFKRSSLWHSVVSEILHAPLLDQNVVTNLRKLPGCAYVNRWKDRFKDVPLIVCGAGPSLKEAAPHLQQLRDRALIVGCGSALSALSHLSVRPHLGIAVDPNPQEYDCLKGCHYRDLPLLFAGRLYPRVFELFDGPRAYIRCGSTTLLQAALEEKIGLTERQLGDDLEREALSVTTLLLSLAHFWGCNPIVLAGVDLAYERKQHYVEGVPVESTTSITFALDRPLRRKNSRGAVVTTLTKWLMEQKTIETYAKKHPHLTLLNGSRGLGFSTIPDIQLENLQFPLLDVEPLIQEAFHETLLPITAEEVEHQLSHLADSAHRCGELIDQLRHAEGGKAVLYEYELEDEPAYPLLLKQQRYAFERLESIAPWDYLKEVADSYDLSLLRSVRTLMPNAFAARVRL